MRRAFLFIIIFHVQHVMGQRNMGSLTFQYAIPVGDFKNKLDVPPTGLLFNILHDLPNQPAFSVGGEIGILQVSGANQNYTGSLYDEYNTFIVASWNHVITAGAICKVNLFPDNRFFALEVDIRAGTNMFLTTSSVSRDVGVNPITNTTITKYYFSDNRTSFTFRAGGGVGLDIPFGQKKKISAIIKGSYLYGSNANYYARPYIVNGKIILSPRVSGTSMLLAEAGLRFGIFNKHTGEE